MAHGVEVVEHDSSRIPALPSTRHKFTVSQVAMPMNAASTYGNARSTSRNIFILVPPPSTISVFSIVPNADTAQVPTTARAPERQSPTITIRRIFFCNPEISWIYAIVKGGYFVGFSIHDLILICTSLRACHDRLILCRGGHR